LACSTKLTLVTQPCEPKQILTCVHFPSAWFVIFFGVRFAQPIPTYRYIGFISLGLLDQTDSHYSGLKTQTNFDLGSLSLSLVSQFFFFFVRFAQPLDTNIHIGFVSLDLLNKTDSHHSALWTQTKFDLRSLSLSLVS